MPLPLGFTQIIKFIKDTKEQQSGSQQPSEGDPEVRNDRESDDEDADEARDGRQNITQPEIKLIRKSMNKRDSKYDQKSADSQP